MVEFDLAGAHVRFSARAGGASAAPYESLNIGALTGDDPAAVRENVATATGRLPAVQLHQVHGSRAVAVDRPSVLAHQADAAVTAERRLALIATTADCVPLALASERAVAVIHAGWRGLADGVIESGVAALRDADPAGRPLAAIGPCARACCYEVGPEVAAALGAGFVDQGRADLPRAAVARLAGCGIDGVQDGGGCTMCRPDIYFSHRRSGPVTGRQGVIAWLR